MDRLDAGEEVLLSSTQSRFLPGGAALINPNTIFATNKRVIIRTPVRVGLAENIEEYFYDQITNIRIEKGIFSASLLFFIPGMTEISKEQRSRLVWGRSVAGVIDAIPKKDAETIYNFVRSKVDEAKRTPSDKKNMKVLKERLARGEITVDEYDELKSRVE